MKFIRHLILFGLLVLAVAALAACSGGGERRLGDQQAFKPPKDGDPSSGTATTPAQTGLQGKDGAIFGDPGKKPGATENGVLKFNLIESFTVNGTNWGNTADAIATAAKANKITAEIANEIILAVKNGTAPYAIKWTLHSTNATIAKKASAIDDTLSKDGSSAITLTPNKGADYVLLQVDVWDSAKPYNCVALFVGFGVKAKPEAPANTDPSDLKLALSGNKVVATWTDPDSGDEWEVTWNGETPVKVSKTTAEYEVKATSPGMITITCKVTDKAKAKELTGSISAYYYTKVGENIIGMRLVPLTADGTLKAGDLLLVEFFVNKPKVAIAQFNQIALGTTAGAFGPAAKTDKAFDKACNPALIGARSKEDPVLAGGLAAINPADLVAGNDLDFPGIWAGMEASLVNNMPAVFKAGFTPSLAGVDAIDCFVPTDDEGNGAVGKFPSAKMDIYKEMGVNQLGLANTTTASGWICSVILKAKTAGTFDLGIIVTANADYTFYNDKDGNNVVINPTKFVKVEVK